MVRVQAVLGLGAFLAEDDDAPDEAEEDPLEVLLELIATDSSAYVPRPLSSEPIAERAGQLTTSYALQRCPANGIAHGALDGLLVSDAALAYA
jgi:hypothetical protein